MWKQLELDHIITPGFGCQANLHGLSSDISPAAIYISLEYNRICCWEPSCDCGQSRVADIREQTSRYDY